MNSTTIADQSLFFHPNNHSQIQCNFTQQEENQKRREFSIVRLWGWKEQRELALKTAKDSLRSVRLHPLSRQNCDVRLGDIISFLSFYKFSFFLQTSFLFGVG